MSGQGEDGRTGTGGATGLGPSVTVLALVYGGVVLGGGTVRVVPLIACAPTIAFNTAAVTPLSFNWIRASVEVSKRHLELPIFATIKASSKPAFAIWTMSSFLS